MIKSSPWGSVDQFKNYIPGFTQVSTPRHGGIMVTKEAADLHLSEHALEVSQKHGNYFCFEEDTEMLIVLLEMEDHWKDFMKDNSFWEKKTNEERREFMIKHLSYSYYDYLLKRDISPNEEVMKQNALQEEFYKAQNAKSPDIVITAWSDCRTLIPGVLIALTGDDKYHYVTEESYHSLQDDPVKYISRPTSELVMVDQKNLPPIQDRLVTYALEKAKPFLKEIDAGSKDAVLEAKGKYYGPRSRFNGELNTAIFYLEEHLNKLLSQSETNIIIADKLKELKTKIHPELKNSNVFEGY